MLSTAPDVTLRWVVFIGAGIGAGFLALSLLMRLLWKKNRTKQYLTRGQVMAQSGYLVLLIGAFYGVGESLFGWYHLRLWLLALGAVWAVVGNWGLYQDAVDERRHA